MRTACLKLCVVLLGLAPFATLGLAGTAFLAPRQQPPLEPWYSVATLFDLPDDGTPIRVMITRHGHDAWVKYPDQHAGDLYLRRRPNDRVVVALRPEHHPDLHIRVKYDPAQRVFRSWCWNLSFDLDGKEIERDDLPPVGHEMEHLPVRMEGDVVWVRYEERPQPAP